MLRSPYLFSTLVFELAIEFRVKAEATLFCSRINSIFAVVVYGVVVGITVIPQNADKLVLLLRLMSQILSVRCEQ